jgi:hypothetical protein
MCRHIGKKKKKKNTVDQHAGIKNMAETVKVFD